MRPPVTSDPLTTLHQHNHWATHQIFTLCRPLSVEQLHQRFEIGPGSLHETLLHVIACMRTWGDRAGGRTVRPWLEDGVTRYPLDELVRLFDQASDELGGVIESARGDLGGVVIATFDGVDYPYTRGVAIVHALVHGTHHRAQCLNMLRRLGVTGLPDLDVNDWQYHTECKP